MRIPVRDRDGHLRQYRGATECPGLWQVGGRFQHRRDSVFLDGVRHDAADVVTGILTRRGGGSTPRAEISEGMRALVGAAK
jgi:putative flavoprotein involved in K+ transport